MNEKLMTVKPVTDLLEYKIRRGEISNEGGHKVWQVALKHPDLVSKIYEIIDMDLSEEETISRVERLV